MADAGKNYAVERRRLELSKMEHEQTIQKGRGRLAEIETSKRLNTKRAELSNLELEAEAEVIRTNEAALDKRMADIDNELQLMVKSEVPKHG